MSNLQYEIFVLLEGYSYEDADGKYRANGSCTLIKGPMKILVDTGSPRDRKKVLERLSSSGVNPDDLDYVVCTHGHIDHVGNLNLFPKSKIIVGFDVCIEEDHYIDHDFKNGKIYKIDENVDVIPTPGHTHTDVSVLVQNVKNYGSVVVCGDLFEKENDGNEWRLISECEETQENNRAKVLTLADYVVPGHGPIFAVRK